MTRNELLQIKLTENEKQKLEQEARKKEMSMSALARVKIFEKVNA